MSPVSFPVLVVIEPLWMSRQLASNKPGLVYVTSRAYTDVSTTLRILIDISKYL